MHLDAKWNYKSPDETLIEEIATGLSISSTVARILVNRGVDSVVKARDFLNPDTKNLHNPFLFKDMVKAVERIRRAVDGNEKILIYGDRDVDGVTSLIVIVETLRSLGSEPSWYIPSNEGYGLHKDAIDRYHNEGVGLIITVDCGISAHDEIEYSNKLGIDVLVTDHHEPSGNNLPNACVLIDPKIKDSGYPFNNLAGCGVSFKVSEALMLSYGKYYGREIIFFNIPFENKESEKDIELYMTKTLNGVILSESHIVKTHANVKEYTPPFTGDEVLVFQSEIQMEKLKQSGLFELSRNNTVLLDNLFCRLKESDRIVARSLKGLIDTDENLAESSKCFIDLYSFIETALDLRMEYFRKSMLDVLALGSIADIVPLIDENRIIVKHGMKQLQETKRMGLRFLLDEALGTSNKAPIDSKFISWSITPVINAAGRLGKADVAVKLLLADSESESKTLLHELLKLNSERKELQQTNIDKFIPLLHQQCDVENDLIYIVIADGVEHGVTGIIASHITRKFGKPAVLLIKEGNEAMGAARSIKGFDITLALSEVSDLLLKYGGHKQAAGMTIELDKIEEFRRRLKQVASEKIKPENLVPVIDIDAELEFVDINKKLLNELKVIEPFGMGNPYPLFSLKGSQINEFSKVGSKGEHLRMKISKNGGSPLGAIGWSFGDLADSIGKNSTVDIAFKLEANNWMNRESLQLCIEDIKCV